MGSKQNCPECHLTFEAELPKTGVLVCPLCNKAFSALLPAAPAPAATVSPLTTPGRQVWRGVLAVGTSFFAAAGLGYAYHLLSSIDHKAAPPAHSGVEWVKSSQPTSEGWVGCEDSVRPTPPTFPVEIIPVAPLEPVPQAAISQTRRARPSQAQPVAIPKDTLPQTPPRSLTLFEERVNRVIDRGIAYLWKRHKYHLQYINYLGLLGLTFLECDIAADNPSVQQIAACIRAHQHQITQTYELALAILFLDRLGDPRDGPLIQAFGKLLVAGQLDCGAWTYGCLVNDARRFVPPSPAGHPWTVLPNLKNPRRLLTTVYRGDNSNTQFAILALWVAQRHGVSARAALSAAAVYFRNTQCTDGSWSYDPTSNFWNDSMVSGGLMSLALSYGLRSGEGRNIRPDRVISVQDPAIDAGLNYLAQKLTKIRVAGNHIVGAEARDPLYFLWSLERMAVIYDLKKIGSREWYPWAAQLLIRTQWADGRWEDSQWSAMNDTVSTCFALLILTRSNFAKDLQLAVQEPPSRPMPAVSGPKNLQKPDASGPTILQGPDAFLGQTRKPERPASTPLGPSIKQIPKTK